MNIIRDLFKLNLNNIYKLFTKEDELHIGKIIEIIDIHKTLGFISLINFSYRIGLWYIYDDMFIRNDIFNVIILGIHALLSSSSFIFKLSENRIKVTPIIWPEGRLHSIIFAYRSIFIMCLFFMYWKTKYEILNYVRGIIVLYTIIFADFVTNYYKVTKKTLNENDSTMRKMPNPFYISEKQMNILNIFYSVSQIFATMNCIFCKNIDKIFIIILPIQIAMFLMTLAKKNIITSGGWHLWYTISLLINYIIPIFSKKIGFDLDEKIIFFSISIIFSILRLKYNINKYILWNLIISIHWLLLYSTNKFRIINY